MSDIVESLLPKYRINYPEHESSFSEALSSFFTQGEYLDVIFICKGNQLLHAHKTVLASVSEFLSQTFRSCGQDIVHISLPDVEHKKLQIVLSFLYEGITKVNFNELSVFREILSFLDIRVLNAEIKPITTISVTSETSAVQPPVESQNQFVSFVKTPEKVPTAQLYTLLIAAQPSLQSSNCTQTAGDDNRMEVEPLLEENTAGLKIKNVSSCSSELLESLWRDEGSEVVKEQTSQVTPQNSHSQTVTMFRGNQTVTMTFPQDPTLGQQFSSTNQATSTINEDVDPLHIATASVKTEVMDDNSSSNISIMSDAAVNTSPVQSDAIVGTMPQIFQASINSGKNPPFNVCRGTENLFMFQNNERLPSMSDKSSGSNTTLTNSSYNKPSTSINSGKNPPFNVCRGTENLFMFQNNERLPSMSDKSSGSNTTLTNSSYNKPSTSAGEILIAVKSTKNINKSPVGENVRVVNNNSLMGDPANPFHKKPSEPQHRTQPKIYTPPLEPHARSRLLEEFSKCQYITKEHATALGDELNLDYKRVMRFFGRLRLKNKKLSQQEISFPEIDLGDKFI